MVDTQIVKKIEYIEQRLLVLEGAHDYRLRSPIIRRPSRQSIWQRTHGMISSRRAASFLQKMRANRKTWSKAV